MATRLRKRKIHLGLNDLVSSLSDSNSKQPKTSRPSTSTNNTSAQTKTTIESEAKTENTSKLPKSFFQRHCAELAQKLLGKTLVRRLDSGVILKGSIVETEAYIGEHDKAAHSYKLKRTARNEAMFMEPGTIYVYHIYGIYTCINISSEGEGCAVLIRAIDPHDSCFHAMSKLRSKNKKTSTKSLKTTNLCSGPSKLTQAFSVDKVTFNQTNICENDSLWLENGDDICEESIVKCARIGVDYAEEWAKKPLRFYVLGNSNVSVKDKDMENVCRLKSEND